MNAIKPYLDSVHRRAAVTPDSVSSCGNAHGAPPGCSAACNYGRNNCTYMASLQLERTLGTKWEDYYCHITAHYHKNRTIIIRLESVLPA